MRVDIPEHKAFIDFPDDTPEEEIRDVLAKHFPPRPTHDDLEGAAVTAADSLDLQDKAPEVKPVVKGTNREIMALKAANKIPPGMVVWPTGNGTAYIIDPNAVQSIYGGSKAESVRKAKIDLRKGGEMESVLLGYPSREAEDTIDVAVTKDGDIVTDLAEMKEHSDNGNVAWAAAGREEDALEKARQVAESVKR